MKRTENKIGSHLAACMAISLFAVTATGCSEIMSADISDVSIVINAPSDSLFTNQPEVLFWWEENGDIEQYRLQLAQPGFDTPSELNDTAILANTLTLTLAEGKWEWRVKGENSGSETQFQRQTLFVDLTAPDKAIALSLDGDTISVASTDSLRWRSQDRLLSGFRHSVSDSLYASWADDSTTFREPMFFDFGSARIIACEDAFGTLSPGRYHWYVVTMDQAGNRRESEHFSFQVE